MAAFLSASLRRSTSKPNRADPHRSAPQQEFPIKFSHVNPYLATRQGFHFDSQELSRPPPIYAKPPVAPRTASPVPSLTSLYHSGEAGDNGDRRYPGNCGGNLIRDLLLYFRPRKVFDPMIGSGTCRDVCRELAVPWLSRDIRYGSNAADPAGLPGLYDFDFVWAHPPYWRQKVYTTDPADLSRAPSLQAFLDGYETFIRNCANLLSPSGKFAILMGDYSDREEGFVPLTFYTKQIAFDAGFRQSCTDIIRFSHGTSSSRKSNRSSFIPGLHDVCMIFERR